MKAIELFRKYSFEDIKFRLDHLFVVNSRYHLTQEACLKWKVIYDRLASSTPIDSDCHIYLATRWEYSSPMVDMNCTVCDDEDKILYPLAEQKNKDEVLGMEVVVEDDVDIDELDLTAGLFWEMTYFPFDSEG